MCEAFSLRGVAATPGSHLPVPGIPTSVRPQDLTEAAAWSFLKARALSGLPAGASGA